MLRSMANLNILESVMRNKVDWQMLVIIDGQAEN